MEVKVVARAALSANLSEASFALSSSLIFMEVVSIFMRSPRGVFLMKESLISSRNVCLLRRLLMSASVMRDYVVAGSLKEGCLVWLASSTRSSSAWSITSSRSACSMLAGTSDYKESIEEIILLNIILFCIGFSRV